MSTAKEQPSGDPHKTIKDVLKFAFLLLAWDQIWGLLEVIFRRF